MMQYEAHDTFYEETDKFRMCGTIYTNKRMSFFFKSWEIILN